jgi:hypothetical protein
MPPAVDARFGSAEALVGTFNGLTANDPVDVEAVFELVRVENERQQTLLNVLRLAEPVQPLEQAMHAQFKQPLDRTPPSELGLRSNASARLARNEGERATAICKKADGRSATIHLVRYDNRWWISGNTWEQDPELKKAGEVDLFVRETTLRALGKITREYSGRVRAGEFKTVDAARKAIHEAMIRHIAQNADQVSRFMKIRDTSSKHRALAEEVEDAAAAHM